jgi:hypothetical protein
VGVFADVPLIVDTSALAIWRRAPESARQRFAEAARANELRMHPVVRLEFLHDAWDVAAFDTRDARFGALPEVPLTTPISSG